MARPIFDTKNVLVIGGAGFIGSHLCDSLIKDNKVICLDNFLTGSERNIDHLLANPNFEFIKHDINKPFKLDPEELGLTKFKAAWQGVQEIYFLASPSANSDVDKYPIETMMVNSVGLKNALDLAVENEATFCYVSSDAVYGSVPEDKMKRVSENIEGIVQHIDAHSARSVGQRFGEALVEQYRRHKKLEVRIARVFNTYGPRMRLLSSRLIANFTYHALNNEEIHIYGGADSLGSYTYIDDMIKGLMKLMEQGDENPVNLGSDAPVKLVHLAEAIIGQLQTTSEVTVNADKPDNYELPIIPDISLAKDKLGWFPVTLFENGLRQTVDDLKASRGLIDPHEGVK
jgi:nucleoside-diphosphate-sugar epimerase